MPRPERIPPWRSAPEEWEVHARCAGFGHDGQPLPPSLEPQLRQLKEYVSANTCQSVTLICSAGDNADGLRNELVSFRQAVDTGIPERTLYRYLAEGDLPSTKIGRCRLI